MTMPYSVEYFNERVLDEIEDWPVSVLADYARLVALLSSALVAVRASAGLCAVTSSVSGWSFSTPSSRRRRRRRSET